MYRRATAPAWILLAPLGTVRLTISLSLSERTEGISVGGGPLVPSGHQSQRRANAWGYEVGKTIDGVGPFETQYTRSGCRVRFVDGLAKYQ